MSISEHAVGPTDLIPERIRFFLDQNLPRVVFLFDDGLDHLVKRG